MQLLACEKGSGKLDKDRVKWSKWYGLEWSGREGIVVDESIICRTADFPCIILIFAHIIFKLSLSLLDHHTLISHLIFTFLLIPLSSLLSFSRLPLTYVNLTSLSSLPTLDWTRGDCSTIAGSCSQPRPCPLT